jgi:transcription initiation factor TFIIE subunit alpha
MPKGERKKTQKKPRTAGEEKRAPPEQGDNDAYKDLLYSKISSQSELAVAEAILHKELTDNDIAKRTGLTVALVRRVLYKFYDNRMAAYRKAEGKKDGLYVYYWKIDLEGGAVRIKDDIRKTIGELEGVLAKEGGTTYFSCGSDPKVTLEKAMANDFTCQKCGKRLEVFDNSHIIASLRNRIEYLKRQVA